MIAIDDYYNADPSVIRRDITKQKMREDADALIAYIKQRGDAVLSTEADDAHGWKRGRAFTVAEYYYRTFDSWSEYATSARNRRKMNLVSYIDLSLNDIIYNRQCDTLNSRRGGMSYAV